MENETNIPGINIPGEDQKPGPELSPEEILDLEKRCEDLARKHNVSKVNAVVFIDEETGKRIFCFLREPNFLTKVSMMDKATTIGVFFASNELREATTLKEESDAITYSESPESDDYKAGVNNFCASYIRSKQIAYKKK